MSKWSPTVLATVLVRLRGWREEEEGVVVDGQPVGAERDASESEAPGVSQNRREDGVRSAMACARRERRSPSEPDPESPHGDARLNGLILPEDGVPACKKFLVCKAAELVVAAASEGTSGIVKEGRSRVAGSGRLLKSKSSSSG
jgi:hypothetical protein